MKPKTWQGDAMVGRMAAIDVGSNTVRVMAAELLADGRLVKFADEFLMTALGRGLADSGQMPTEAIATTAEFVRAFLAECGPLDEVYCVGTAAARDASNTRQLQEALQAQAGVKLRVLSGAEEARLTYVGAISATGDLQGRRPLVADIGGRSTEMALEDAGGLHTASINVGARSITEEHLRSDPPTRAEVMAARRTTKLALGQAANLLGKADLCVVTGGTACSAALLAGNLWDMSLWRLQRLRRELCAMPLAMRRQALVFDPSRAEVICGGLLVLEALVAHSAVRRIRISTGGLREGLLLTNTGVTEIVSRMAKPQWPGT